MAHPVSNKILIAIQFWDGDKAQALKLARYLADLEPRHTPLADIIFISRFDCKQDFLPVVKEVSRKFDVFSYVSPRRGIGWPDGCNSLWFGAMEWAYSFMESKRVPQYKAIFTCEGDGAPVLPNWLQLMSSAWDGTQQGQKKVYIAGPLVKGNGVEEHINGNCLISGNLKFLHWITRRVGDCPSRMGWDYFLRDAFKQWGWANIPGMVSWYNTPHFPKEQFADMQRQGLIWVHGDKSNSLIDYGREAFKV